MMGRIIILGLASTAVAAILYGSRGPPANFVGTWFAERTVRGELMQGLTRRDADGTMRITLRTVDRCVALEPITLDVGWRQEGEEYVVILPEGATPREHRYRITWLASDLVRYLAGDGMQTTELRVPQDFEFPPPQGCQ